MLGGCIVCTYVFHSTAAGSSCCDVNTTNKVKTLVPLDPQTSGPTQEQSGGGMKKSRTACGPRLTLSVGDVPKAQSD